MVWGVTAGDRVEGLWVLVRLFVGKKQFFVQCNVQREKRQWRVHERRWMRAKRLAKEWPSARDFVIAFGRGRRGICVIDRTHGNRWMLGKWLGRWLGRGLQ